MTFKEWLESKGIDTVTEELKELVAPMANGDIVVTAEVDDFDASFVFEFVDGSYLTQSLSLDNEVEEDFNSTTLLRDLADGLWENVHDILDELTSYQRDFITKLVE